MILRRGWLLGLGVALAAAPAFGQAPTGQARSSASRQPRRSARHARRRPRQPVRDPRSQASPRTLAEALAATYSTQPALLAERAKLRATDENVPQALAGWRPTVVMAGTAGYGDGMSRIYSNLSGRWFSTRRPTG